MKCGLIFYMAHKTGYCETALSGGLASVGIVIDKIYTAFSPEHLVKILNESFQRNDLNFIIGGLSRKDENNLAQVLSKTLSKNSSLPEVQKICNPFGGADGYLLKSGKQYAAALPDEPEQIPSMADAKLFAYLQNNGI